MIVGRLVFENRRVVTSISTGCATTASRKRANVSPPANADHRRLYEASNRRRHTTD